MCVLRQSLAHHPPSALLSRPCVMIWHGLALLEVKGLPSLAAHERRVRFTDTSAVRRMLRFILQGNPRQEQEQVLLPFDSPFRCFS